jgi:hypothetical protein
MSSKNRKNEYVSMWVSIPLLMLVCFFIVYLGVYRTYRDFQIEKTKSERVKTQFQGTFSGLEQVGPLTDAQRNWVIQKANKEKCACGCGYTLAACLKTDEQCPIREKNLTRVKELSQIPSTKDASPN